MRTKWHRWYAWYPIEVGREVIWWAWVERRWNPEGGEVRYLTSWDPGMRDGGWEYRKSPEAA